MQRLEQQGLIEGLRRQKFSLESCVSLAKRYVKSKQPVMSMIKQLKLYEIANLRVSLELYAQKQQMRRKACLEGLIEDLSELQLKKLKNGQNEQLYAQIFVKSLRERQFCLQDLKRFNQISQLSNNFLFEVGYLLKTREVFELSNQLETVLAPLSKTQKEKHVVLGLAEYLTQDFMARKNMDVRSQFQQSVDKIIKKIKLSSNVGDIFFSYYCRTQQIVSKVLNKCELNEMMRIFRLTRDHIQAIGKSQYGKLKSGRKCLNLLNRKIKKRIDDIKYYKKYQKREKQGSPRETYFNQQYHWLDEMPSPSPNQQLIQRDKLKTDYRIRRIEKEFSKSIKQSISKITKRLAQIERHSCPDSDEEEQYEQSDYNSEQFDQNEFSDEMQLSVSSVASSEE